MNIFTVSMILALSVSADALACGFAAGASRLRVPMGSAITAAAVSAAFVAIGMAAWYYSAPLIPESVTRYISFSVLAVFGLLKLCGGAGGFSADCNSDRVLSAGEGAALGAALSVDGLAAGFGCMGGLRMLLCSSAFTLLFTACALYFGAKGGRGVRPGRSGNLAAGMALIVLAVQKLL